MSDNETLGWVEIDPPHDYIFVWANTSPPHELAIYSVVRYEKNKDGICLVRGDGSGYTVLPGWSYVMVSPTEK